MPAKKTAKSAKAPALKTAAPSAAGLAAWNTIAARELKRSGEYRQTDVQCRRPPGGRQRLLIRAGPAVENGAAHRAEKPETDGTRTRSGDYGAAFEERR
jgi:hypothetical protein